MIDEATFHRLRRDDLLIVSREGQHERAVVADTLWRDDEREDAAKIDTITVHTLDEPDLDVRREHIVRLVTVRRASDLPSTFNWFRAARHACRWNEQVHGDAQWERVLECPARWLAQAWLGYMNDLEATT